jgi:hypothetical protein
MKHLSQACLSHANKPTSRQAVKITSQLVTSKNYEKPDHFHRKFIYGKGISVSGRIILFVLITVIGF